MVIPFRTRSWRIREYDRVRTGRYPLKMYFYSSFRYDLRNEID